jgi:hypothetical protein
MQTINEFAKPFDSVNDWQEEDQIALRKMLDEAVAKSTEKPMTSEEFDAWLAAQ